MRWHRRAIPGNGDYRRDGNARTGEALASLGRARHWQSEVKFGTGLALLSVSIAMTSTLQHRNGKQSKGIGRTSTAWALNRGAKRRQSLTRPRQSTASNRSGEARLWAPMRWQTEAVQRAGKANRVAASQVKALAKQGVTRHWQSKLSHGLAWRQTRVLNIKGKGFQQ